MLPGRRLTAQHFLQLWCRNLQLKFPLLQDFRTDYSCYQVVAFHLHIDVLQSRSLRERKKFSSHEGIKSGGSQRGNDFLAGPLHLRIFGVVPQELSVQVLQKHESRQAGKL